MIDRLARRHYERGRRFALQSKTEEAIEAYQKACDLGPSFPEPFFALAKILATRDELDWAKGLLDQAIKLDPDPEFYEWRGYVQGRRHRFFDALEDYERAVEGGSQGARINLGRMLLATQRYDDAAEVLEACDLPMAAVLLDAVDRYREFSGTESRPVESSKGPRAAHYLFARTLVLGTLNDGGIEMKSARYRLLTAQHIAVTVRRLVMLMDARALKFDVVCGAGAHHGHLAAFVAERLALPHVAPSEAKSRRVLVVSAVVEGLQAALKLRHEVASKAVMHFALAFAPGGEPNSEEPEIVGNIGQAAVPWYRVSEYSRLEPHAGAEGTWPGFRVGVPFIDPNRGRVLAELRAAYEAGSGGRAGAILDWYQRHPQVRAFDWEA